MLLQPLSVDGKPQGKCLAKKCSECNFYRKWRFVVDEMTRREQEAYKCSFESLFFIIPDVIGAIDGCQQATNETRNTVFHFGQASATAFNKISESMDLPKIRLIEDGET